jgi:isoleucyl-tRNA synthetase
VANLYDFDPRPRADGGDLVPLEELEPVDRYALGRYADAALRMRRAWESFDFQLIFHAVNALVTVDLSALYVDVAKDRLYTLGADAPSRRAAQTVMYHVVDGLARLLAPVLPVTAEQLWKVLPGRREPSVHLAVFPAADALETMSAGVQVADWERLLAIRSEVNAAIEAQRKAKVLGNSLMAAVRLTASGADLALLRSHAESLPSLLIVSGVDVVEGPADGALAVAVEKAAGVKCERCWRIVPAVSGESGREGLCDRCVDALAAPVAR